MNEIFEIQVEGRLDATQAAPLEKEVEEAVRGGFQIGEVAAPATGNQDFLAGFVGVVQQQHPPAALPGRHGTHEAGGAGAEDDDIEGLSVHALW